MHQVRPAPGESDILVTNSKQREHHTLMPFFQVQSRLSGTVTVKEVSPGSTDNNVPLFFEGCSYVDRMEADQE